MSGTRAAVLGFRAHTGWAAVVALASGNDAPAIIDRRRIAFEPATARFIYHKAAELPPASAAKLIAEARATAEAAAAREIEKLLIDLQRAEYSVSLACIPAGNAKLPEKLNDILAAHSRIHAAEGTFYRETLARACERLGLEVRHVPERDVWPLAADALALDRGGLEAQMKTLGARLGPPWSEDQKLATLAAWIGLARGETRPARARRP